jgi:hypothetical protein
MLNLHSECTCLKSQQRTAVLFEVLVILRSLFREVLSKLFFDIWYVWFLPASLPHLSFLFAVLLCLDLSLCYVRCLYYLKQLNRKPTDLLVEATFQADLFLQIEASRKDLSCLMEQYQAVSNRTKSLHQVSEQLLADQVLSFLHVWVFSVLFFDILSVGLITLPRRCVCFFIY